jgi:hypothetical protein
LAAGKAERGANVGMLTLNPNELARYTIALAEVPIVKGQGTEARCSELVRSRLYRRRILGTCEAMSEHNAWSRLNLMGRVVEITHTGDAINVEAHSGLLNHRSSPEFYQ